LILIIFICKKEFKRKEFKSKVLATFGHYTGLIQINTPEFIGLSLIQQ